MMRKLLIVLLITTISIGYSCNKKTTSSTKSSSSTSTKQYKVSQVYKYYEQLAPRLTAKANDETIYIVNFWATWCTQCRKEIPEMVKLDNKYKKDKNVKILFVNLDEEDRQRLVDPFLRNYKISGEVVSLTDPDQEKWIEAINKNWNGSLPGTLFFKGDKHRKFYGYPLTYPELERNIGFMKNKK